MHIRYYLAALEFVNGERKSLGLEPLNEIPLGRPGDPHRCAIARAVPGSTVSATIELPDGSVKPLPAKVRRFVQSFDVEGFCHDDCQPGGLVDGGIDDEKGCLVPA